MRKWHRWLALVFGAFLLFIAITGVASHLAAMAARGSIFEDEKNEARPMQPAPAATPAGPEAVPAAPPAEAAQRKPNPKRKLVGFFHHLHSGEEFGPVGVIISLLSGLAMIFFSISGLWLYYDMYIRRDKVGRKGVFWN
jgi:uncharacterized iron-regulated membrane protein